MRNIISYSYKGFVVFIKVPVFIIIIKFCENNVSRANMDIYINNRFDSGRMGDIHFTLAVPLRECLRKHSCMSFPFFIALVNGN